MAYHYQKPLLVSDIEGLKAPIILDQTGLIVKKESKSIAEGICEILDKKNLTKFSKNIKKYQLNIIGLLFLNSGIILYQMYNYKNHLNSN